MTLTYRGQKYDQQKVAGTASAKPALTYRGVFLRQVIWLNRRSSSACLRRKGGFLFASIKAVASTGAEGDGLGKKAG